MHNNCKLPHGKPQPDEKTFQTPETLYLEPSGPDLMQ